MQQRVTLTTTKLDVNNYYRAPRRHQMKQQLGLQLISGSTLTPVSVSVSTIMSSNETVAVLVTVLL